MIFVTCKLINGYKAYDFDSDKTLHISESELVDIINNKKCLNAIIENGMIEYLAGCSYALRDKPDQYDCDTDKNYVVAEIYSHKKKKVVGYQILKAYRDRFGTAWKSMRLSVKEALEEHRVLQFVNVKCNGEKLYPKYGKLYKMDIDTGNVIPTKSKEVEIYRVGNIEKAEKVDKIEKVENSRKIEFDQSKYIDKANECIEQYNDCSNKAMADYVDKKLKRKMNSKYTAALVAGILLLGLSTTAVGTYTKPVSPVTQIRQTVSAGVPKDDLSTVIRIESAQNLEVTDSDILIDGIKVGSMEVLNTGYGIESSIRSLYQKDLSRISSNTMTRDLVLLSEYTTDDAHVLRHIPVFGDISYTIKAPTGKEYSAELDGNDINIKEKDGSDILFKASFDKDGGMDFSKVTKIKTDISTIQVLNILVQLYNDNNDFHQRLLEAE